MRFLDPLIVIVISNPFPATILVPITIGLDPDAFTLARGEVFRLPRVVLDLFETIFLNLSISLTLSHLSLFCISSSFYNFYPS